MFHLYTILLFSLFFIYSISNDIHNLYPNRTIASSRSIYELVQLRRTAARLAAYHNKIRQHNNTNDSDYTNTSRNKIIDSKNNHNRLLLQRLKAIILVSSIALSFMTVIVIICIVIRYCEGKNPEFTERIEQTKPLNASRQLSRPIRFSETPDDTRNFSRKQRTFPVAV